MFARELVRKLQISCSEQVRDAYKAVAFEVVSEIIVLYKSYASNQGSGSYEENSDRTYELYFRLVDKNIPQEHYKS
jgi:hypothetical protein